ncbi:hypothetical protein [Microscilla marina]|uniref:Uncharacterized protein n=1 Tax=Microscilla marina ATCC 23134 TaxID=313606 RepID=A1ZJX7_MICM2|nr:hypothetical protein [Microscilla marina]EAY29430.1 hypothetical protein M23134_01490 [Microscilla marina ATCC 23134]
MGKTIKEALAGIGELNGFTGGAFISFNIEVHKPHALTILQVLWEALHTPLVITPEERSQELYIFQQEEIFQKEAYGFDIQGIEKYYLKDSIDTKKTSGINLKSILRCHKQIIQSQKTLVIIHADSNNLPVQQAQQWLQEKFDAKTTPTSLTAFANLQPTHCKEYMPQRPSFPALSKAPRLLKLFFAHQEAVQSTSARILNQLVLDFFRETWFEYVRYIEKSDYDLNVTHRFMPYAQQMGLSFYTKASSDVLRDLIQHRFYKHKQDFQHLQTQIYNQTMILTDQPIRAYYYLMQEYFYTGEYRTIQDIALEMKKVSYTAFTKHYDALLKSLAWERVI